MSTAVWTLQYKDRNGRVMDTQHPSRREAVEVLSDTLIFSALQMWALGEKRPVNEPNRQRFIERGDQVLAYAMELLLTDEDDGDGSYLLKLTEGRRWVLFESSALPRS